jgi:hypothetical protein
MTSIAIIKKNGMDTTSRKDGVVVNKYTTGNTGSDAEEIFNNLFSNIYNNDNINYKMVSITDEEYAVIKEGWILDRKDNKIKTREDILADSR